MHRALILLSLPVTLLLASMTFTDIGCAKSQIYTRKGSEWRLCPLSTLSSNVSINRVVGLSLNRTLTMQDFRNAISEAPVDIRVVYFIAGNVRGNRTWPQAVSADIAEKDLTKIHEETVSDGEVWIRRNVIPIILEKKLYRFLNANLNEEEAVKLIDNSSSVRNGLRALVKEYQNYEDIRMVFNNKRGFITGLQVSGAQREVVKFANLVRADGFTIDKPTIFSGLRPSDPSDLIERMKPLEKDINARELLHRSQIALEYFKPYWKDKINKI